MFAEKVANPTFDVAYAWKPKFHIKLQLRKHKNKYQWNNQERENKEEQMRFHIWKCGRMHYIWLLWKHYIWCKWLSSKTSFGHYRKKDTYSWISQGRISLYVQGVRTDDQIPCIQVFYWNVLQYTNYTALSNPWETSQYMQSISQYCTTLQDQFINIYQEMKYNKY